MTERAKVAFKVVELKDVDLNEAGEHKEKKKKNETEKAPPPKPLTFEMVFGVEWIRVRKRMFQIMDSPGMQVFLVALLLLSLFITDSWVLGNQPDSATMTLDGVLSAVFVVFVFEVVSLSLCETNYFNSFFFYMDILGTLSIILDINYISSGFLPTGTAASGSILRATRTAKLGARYGRLMRILKLMKFIQYIPCLKKNDDDEMEPSASSLRRVTNELSSMISQRVAALVMIVVIIVPFLSYPTSDFSTDAWIQSIKAISKNSTTSPWDITDFADRFENFYKYKDVKLYSLDIENPDPTMTYSKTWSTRTTLRDDNKLVFAIDYKMSAAQPTRYDIKAIMDYTAPNQYDALCGILLVTLVILILISFSASFQTEVEILVVEPLEKMMGTLRSSAQVMLKSMNVIDKENNEDEDKDYDSDDGEMETLMLEKMVEKLTRLVKLTYPGANDIDVTDDVDNQTASWLNEAYSKTSKNKSDDFYLVREEEEAEDQDPHEEVELKRQYNISSVYSKEIRDFDKLTRWDFDVLEYSQSEMVTVFKYLFESLNFFDDFQVPQQVFVNFFDAVASKYHANTYHNFHHGCDVAYTVYRLVIDSRVHLCFSQLEMFSLLTAAIAHDIGHPGVNNVYLVKAKHSFALQYNDRSPLENMHCAVVYDLLTEPSTNIFLSLSEEHWREARKIILTSILGTDMTHHFEQINKIQLFLEVNETDIHSFCSGDKDEITAFQEDKDRLFIIELCLHCADVSNPYKPFAQYEKWAGLVVEEFSLQGDKEKGEGLEISPMCDRSAINICDMQMGFIQFVVAPLILAVIKLFYPLHEIGINMRDNFVEYGRLKRAEILADVAIKDKESAVRKLDDRVIGFTEKFQCIEEFKTKPVRHVSTRSKLFQRQQPMAKNKTSALGSISSPRQKRQLGKE